MGCCKSCDSGLACESGCSNHDHGAAVMGRMLPGELAHHHARPVHSFGPKRGLMAGASVGAGGGSFKDDTRTIMQLLSSRATVCDPNFDWVDLLANIPLHIGNFMTIPDLYGTGQVTLDVLPTGMVIPNQYIFDLASALGFDLNSYLAGVPNLQNPNAICQGCIGEIQTEYPMPDISKGDPTNALSGWIQTVTANLMYCMNAYGMRANPSEWDFSKGWQTATCHVQPSDMQKTTLHFAPAGPNYVDDTTGMPLLFCQNYLDLANAHYDFGGYSTIQPTAFVCGDGSIFGYAGPPTQQGQDIPNYGPIPNPNYDPSQPPSAINPPYLPPSTGQNAGGIVPGTGLPPGVSPTTNAIDPNTGIPYAEEGGIDPATGIPYTQEGQYGYGYGYPQYPTYPYPSYPPMPEYPPPMPEYPPMAPGYPPPYDAGYGYPGYPSYPPMMPGYPPEYPMPDYPPMIQPPPDPTDPNYAYDYCSQYPDDPACAGDVPVMQGAADMGAAFHPASGMLTRKQSSPVKTNSLVKTNTALKPSLAATKTKASTSSPVLWKRLSKSARVQQLQRYKKGANSKGTAPAYKSSISAAAKQALKSPANLKTPAAKANLATHLAATGNIKTASMLALKAGPQATTMAAQLHGLHPLALSKVLTTAKATTLGPKGRSIVMGDELDPETQQTMQQWGAFDPSAFMAMLMQFFTGQGQAVDPSMMDPNAYPPPDELSDDYAGYPPPDEFSDPNAGYGGYAGDPSGYGGDPGSMYDNGSPDPGVQLTDPNATGTPAVPGNPATPPVTTPGGLATPANASSPGAANALTAAHQALGPALQSAPAPVAMNMPGFHLPAPVQHALNPIIKKLPAGIRGKLNMRGETTMGGNDILDSLSKIVQGVQGGDPTAQKGVDKMAKKAGGDDALIQTIASDVVKAAPILIALMGDSGMDYATFSSTTLYNLAKQGDKNALHELFTRTYNKDPNATQYARKLLGLPDDIDHLTATASVSGYVGEDVNADNDIPYEAIVYSSLATVNRLKQLAAQGDPGAIGVVANIKKAAKNGNEKAKAIVALGL